MSSSANKQDMSMDDILASIRSYVSEGQNLPKSEAIKPQPFSNQNNVIQLTDEIIPIETISLQPINVPFDSTASVQVSGAMHNPMYPDPKVAPSPSASFQGSPFDKLESEISSSAGSGPNISTDDLLNQLASPLIKSWLDKNLRKIVEDAVQKEIDRMRRG